MGTACGWRRRTNSPQRFAIWPARRVLIDPAQSSSWYFEAASRAGIEIVRRDDPCAMPRACKNAVEIAGAKSAHVRDGVALTRFLHWVATAADLAQFDEVDVARKLESFRTETGVLKDISFDTIAAAGSHGALPHYRPTRRLAKRIEPGSLLLVDSGAQYFDGTTDVTRTVAIGEPTAEMRERFTAVLAGHLALARVLFPVGTTGSALDALARTPLWTRGLDYDHGTGHGVGSYLGVHEGPQRIAKAPNTVALRPGMIVSNEPGYYKAGEYGIRIENLQYVTEPRAVPGGDRPMLGFETLTFAPIDRRLIVREQLTAAERFQLDEYHARTLAVIGAGLPEPSRSWLVERVRADLRLDGQARTIAATRLAGAFTSTKPRNQGEICPTEDLTVAHSRGCSRPLLCSVASRRRHIASLRTCGADRSPLPATTSSAAFPEATIVPRCNSTCTT